jgi:hypothetical protein
MPDGPTPGVYLSGALTQQTKILPRRGTSLIEIGCGLG